ncbi:hypothetical protein KC338_g116 [Hortaea werneckii]|nr:hypothetical protein KC338_g116 [Hortaea werneckii]
MTNPLSKLSEVFHHHDRDQEHPTVPSESQVYPGTDEAKAQYRARQVAQDAQLSSVQPIQEAPSGDAPPPPYAPPPGLPPDMFAKAGPAGEKSPDASETSAPLNGYPRPDFHRTASGLVWHSLNGPWDFVFDDTDTGLSDFCALLRASTSVACTKSCGIRGRSRIFAAPKRRREAIGCFSDVELLTTTPPSGSMAGTWESIPEDMYQHADHQGI